MALAAGSIAFTGFYDMTTLSFSFAALEDIPAGTVISFTDNTWDGTAFTAGASTWTWTAGSDISAGTIVTLDGLEKLDGQSVLAPTSNLGTVTYSGVDDPDFNVGTLFAYTGDVATPEFLTAISSWPYNDQVTIEGTGLVEGQTAMNLLRDAQNGWNLMTGIAVYTGPISGFASFSDYLAAINDIDNWTLQKNDGTAVGEDGTFPDLPLPQSAITIDAGVQTVSFEPASTAITFTEGDSGETILTFTVIRSGSTLGALDFTGSFIFGAGVTAADFGGVLPDEFSGTIADGQDQVTIQIAVSGDIKFESDETFTLVLETAVNAQSEANIGGGDKAVVTVENNDVPQTVGFAAGSQSFIITEGDNGEQYITFTIERTGGVIGDLNFTVALEADKVNADDFGGQLPTLIAGVILDGESSSTVTLKLTGDTRFEGDESFSMVLASAENELVGAVISPEGTVSYVTITNDDAIPSAIGAGDVVEGQIIVTGSDHFTIAAGGILDVPSQTAILWKGQSAGAIIDNAGTIGGSGDIAFGLSGVTGDLTFNNLVGGVIEGNMNFSGIGASASATINNAGMINVGDGGYFRLSTSGGVVTLNNLATGYITRDNSGGDVIKDATKAVINNWGKIVSPSDIPSGYEDPQEYGGDAVDIGSGTGNVIHNYDGGLIEGSRHAITGKRDVNIINDAGGVIAGRNGSGINFDNNTDVARLVTVTNYGTILGQSRGYSDSDGDAIDADGLVKVDNYGMIAGLGANGYHNGGLNHSEALAIGGGVINNYAGGTIYSVERAIQVDDSEEGGAPAAVTIFNAGLIHAVGGQAINIIGEQQDTLTNSGTIIGSVTMGGGDDTVTLDENSLIAGIVYLGDGNDILSSVEGNLVVEGGSGNDTIFGGSGSDTAVFSGNAAGYAWVSNPDGSITITDNDTTDGDDGVDIISGVETLKFADGTVALTDDDYNTAPENVALSATGIAEDAETGTIIGLLSASDAEDDQLAFSLSDSANETFAIQIVDGEIRLVLNAALDFETQSSYEITVSVSDGGFETRETFEITVTDELELVTGNGKANTLDGSDYGDLIKGLAGNDRLNAGAGDDVLSGGTGADKLRGGEGADTFLFVKGDTGKSRTTADTIVDFSLDDGDIIDISGYDADTKTADDQEFTFIGAEKFSKQAGELRAVAEKSATVVYGDVDGNGKADFMIRLDPGVQLGVDNFVL